MTIEELMVGYLLIAIAGGVTLVWSIFVPAIQIVKQLDPRNPVLIPFATLLSGILIFILFVLSGPVMVFILARKDSFLENFVKGLLNND
jgi:hypothetical protein